MKHFLENMVCKCKRSVLHRQMVAFMFDWRTVQTNSHKSLLTNQMKRLLTSNIKLKSLMKMCMFVRLTILKISLGSSLHLINMLFIKTFLAYLKCHKQRMMSISHFFLAYTFLKGIYKDINRCVSRSITNGYTSFKVNNRGKR